MNVLRNNLVKQFLLMLAPLTALIAVMAYYSHHRTIEEERRTLAMDEANGLSLGTVAITKELKAIASDLMIIAQHSEFEEMHQRLNPDAVWHLQRDLLLLVNNKRLYDQARYIDKTGMEVVRVNFNNGHPATVPKEMLQDKSQRYYFREALTLNKGEIYFSPLDLNIERGEIERPFKPMIRIATPVFNSEGRKRGIVILNYIGANLIKQFETVATGISGDAMILNSNSYWLHAPDPGLEWGFMLDHDETFAKNYPSAWEKVTRADKGQFLVQDGLFTFETIYPLLEGFKSSTETTEAFAPSIGKVEGKAYFWKIMSQIPGETLAAMSESAARKLLLVFGPLYIILAVIVGGLAHVRVRHVEAEAGRQESERRKGLIVSSALDAIITINENGNVVEFNPSAEKIFGYASEESIGRDIAELIIPPALREKHKRSLRHYVETGEKRIIGKYSEFTGIRNDGEEFPVELLVVPINHGGSHLFTAFIRDITERKQAMEALKESETRFKRLFEKAPLGYQSLNINGEYIEVNKAWLDMFGYSREEVIGHPFEEFLFEEGFVEKNLPRFKKAGEIQLPGTEMRCKDGSIIIVHIYGRIGYNDEGDFLQTHCILTNITERTRIEMELRKAKEEAETANLYKSEFLAAMSHDLRTPLSAIMGFAEMMDTHTFGPLGDPHYDEYAMNIHKSGKLLVSLINGILDLSKIEAGKYELTEEPMDVTSLIQDSIDLIMSQADEKNVHLTTEIEPNLPKLFVDERAVTQILNNLLSNAIKFTPDDGAATIYAKMDGDGSMVVQVADTGIGMSRQDITKALEPFRQVGSMHSPKHEGTGLGLYISCNLLGLHGGTLDIESEEGKGTTVTVKFPPERVVRDS